MLRILTLSMALTILVIASPGDVSAQITAFRSGERVTGGTRQCIYEALGNEYTRTVESWELCPLSIRVQRGQRGSGGGENEWTALGRGLREIGATLERSRARAEDQAFRQAALDQERELTEAALALEAQRMKRATEAQLSAALVEHLRDEYLASEEYLRASTQYHAIRDSDGPEAASQFWEGVQANYWAYIQRRWVEMTPRGSN